MIQVFKSGEINQQKWDNCILNAVNGTIYGLYDSIQTACDEWLGFVWNNYEAVAALPIKRKLGLTYSWHPQFLGPLGIFASQPDALNLNDFIQLIKQESWWIKMYYYQNLSPGLTTSEWNYQLLEFNQKPIDDIVSNYNDNTRRNINKAAKAHVTIKEIMDVDILVNTFRDEKGSQISNLNDESYYLLKKLIIRWQEKGLASIKAVYQFDELLAVGCFLQWRNQVVYYKGAVTEAGRNTGAMHFLMDQEIKSAHRENGVFDFGGSNVETVARFYKGFGATNHHYYYTEYKKFKIS